MNEAEDQAERFRQQIEEKDAGDDEAMHYEANYVRVLKYGPPPTAGEGIGIDRLMMLFTDAPSISDVLLFPRMRPESWSNTAVMKTENRLYGGFLFLDGNFLR